MAENFTKEQLAEFKDAFSLFDTNHSGVVNVDDIGTIFRSLGKYI